MNLNPSALGTSQKAPSFGPMVALVAELGSGGVYFDASDRRPGGES